MVYLHKPGAGQIFLQSDRFQAVAPGGYNLNVIVEGAAKISPGLPAHLAAPHLSLLLVG